MYKPLLRQVPLLLTALPRNACLTLQHQRDILEILTRCHTCYLDLLSSIFNLHTAPVEDLVNLVRQVLESGRLKEAAVYICTFGIQEKFSMEQVKERGGERKGEGERGGGDSVFSRNIA